MIHIRWFRYDLHFKTPAGTSRGVLHDKTTYIIHMRDGEGRQGFGECGPLPGLSPDFRSDLEDSLEEVCRKMSQAPLPELPRTGTFVEQMIPGEWPAVRMGFETALRDLLLPGDHQVFQNEFHRGKAIPINGLIWMGDPGFMMEQVKRKMEAGYTCIKMKIGAIDFRKELDILKFIRDQPHGDRIVLRVDANGAFSSGEVMEKLDRLAELDIHSIEQPVRPGNRQLMARICRQSAVPIALDEELIGYYLPEDKVSLLEEVKPQFIVLKPTLLGGFHQTDEWIRLAEDRDVGWWVTSALESNIGLNAIAQFTAEYPLDMEQGLGTGQLYTNNFPSPLTIRGGFLHYELDAGWDLSALDFQ